MIPLVDLKAQYAKYQGELDAAVSDVVRSAHFIQGPHCEKFAKDFARFCGGGEVVLCGNGTDALYLALRELLGPGRPGDEVITVANTFIATAEAVTTAGFRPVFVDINPSTYVMDPSCIEQVITGKTRAIIPVHLFGQMAEMDWIMNIAEDHDLFVIEDAAQAHGASYLGKGPGQWGNAACFSFYPGKNLGAWGDAGGIFTRDSVLAEKMKMRANHGRSEKYIHTFEGVNSRLDEIQAAVLSVKLQYLAEWNELRLKHAKMYSSMFSGEPLVVAPHVDPRCNHVFYVYVIQVPKRDQILASLKKRGIDAGIHYPVPLHRQPAYDYLNVTTSLPVTEQAAKSILSIPLYPELRDSDIRFIVESVGDALHGEA